MFYKCENEFWIVRGDVSKGNPGMHHRKRYVLFVFKKFEKRKGQIAFCVDRYNEASIMEQLDLKTVKSIVDGVKKLL